MCRGRRLSPWCQTFALFIPDDCRGQGAIDRYEALLALYRRELACNADLVAPCCTRGEILAATLDGRCAALLAVEGGAALNGQVERVDALAADGVKIHMDDAVRGNRARISSMNRPPFLCRKTHTITSAEKP